MDSPDGGLLEAPEWDGTIPKGQECQRHPLFTARDSFDEEDKEDSSLVARIELLELEFQEVMKSGVPMDCENKADLGVGIVIYTKTPEPRVHYVCQRCHDFMESLQTEINTITELIEDDEFRAF